MLQDTEMFILIQLAEIPTVRRQLVSSAVNFKTVVIEKTGLTKFNFPVEILVLSDHGRSPLNYFKQLLI